MRLNYLALLLWLFSVFSNAATHTLYLWNHQSSAPPIQNSHGTLTHISAPYLSIIHPKHPNGHAILIAAGGGYKRIEQGKEGLPAAHYLAAHGYTVYLLVYRLPSEQWSAGKSVAFQDAQRALRIVSAREQHLSVLGFSAGAHLLAMVVNRPCHQFYTPVDRLDNHLVRVEGQALIYPIVTLERPYNHTSTHRVLLGSRADKQQERLMSVQNYINSDSPPLFIVQAKDDPISNPENSLILERAAKQVGVTAKLYRFTQGGHGFGLGKPGAEAAAWPKDYLIWLQHLPDLQ